MLPWPEAGYAEQGGYTIMNNSAIDEELRHRARQRLSHTHLAVHYYRVRRRLAFPLPLVQRPTWENQIVLGLAEYPWEIWLMWEIEERINALGWAAQLLADDDAMTVAARELAAIAQWAPFGQSWPCVLPNHWHGLAVGHYLRILCLARSQWSWIDAQLRRLIEAALAAHVELAEPWMESAFSGALADATALADLAARADAADLVHNIKLICLLGYALAANTIGAAPAPRLNASCQALIKLLFKLRDDGASEAVAYDGYTLDFIACFLASLPSGQRDVILDDRHVESYLRQSLYLSAPGDVTAVAELSDVEPVRMPFHITAQARLQAWRPQSRRAWYLRRCRIERLRSDALACLRAFPDAADESAPTNGALDAVYARVLRSGWGPQDVAVAIAASTSWHGHIHHDFGSLCIGTQGQWLLTDPGYQQYHPGSERDFTLGPKAHNAPLIDGWPMNEKSGCVIAFDQPQKDLWHAHFDLTACYPIDALAAYVGRTIWLLGNQAVVVADVVRGRSLKQLEYNWHSHPDAACAVQAAPAGGPAAALFYLAPTTMWIASPQAPTLALSDILRLRGSRGHQTLCAALAPAPIVWWIFSFGPAPHSFTISSDNAELSLLGRCLTPGD